MRARVQVLRARANQAESSHQERLPGPTDEEPHHALPRCLQDFKDTYLNEMIIDFQAREQHRAHYLENNIMHLGDMFYEFMSFVEESTNVKIPEHFKRDFENRYKLLPDGKVAVGGGSSSTGRYQAPADSSISVSSH